MHNRMSWFASLVALAMMMANVTHAHPKANGETLSDLDWGARKATLDAIREKLQKNYYSAERLLRILSRLDDAEASGRYTTSDPTQFATLVTEDMQSVTKDTHLYLSFHPDWYRLALLPADPAQAKEQENYENKVARTTNFGLVESKVLTGNVRYLKIDGFSWIDGEGLQAYEAAMRFLKGGSAIIIDLRGNRGGNTIPAYYLLSHFFGPDELMYTWHSSGKPDVQLRANPYLPNGRLSNIPLYILVNGRSRSAAEAIAYAVKQFKFGEIVGERTEGAANPSEDFAVHPHYRLSIPVMYSEDPVSHSDWEGVGVLPTIPTSSSDALDVAYGKALEKLLASTREGEEKDFLMWAQDGLAAKGTRFNPGLTELSALTGNYGSLSIQLRGSSLWLFRDGRPPLELKPIGSPALFEATEDFMLRVKLDSNKLELLHIGGRKEAYSRGAKAPQPVN